MMIKISFKFNQSVNGVINRLCINIILKVFNAAVWHYDFNGILYLLISVFGIQ